MNLLSTITNQNASVTMSSREIAELCEKQHAHVLRDIRNMLNELYPNLDSLDLKGIFVKKDLLTGLTDEICLPKRETMILVSGYRIDLRAKIIDRLEELESQQTPTAVIPQSYSEALMLAAKLQAEKERNAPKVAFVDHYVDVGTSKSLREVSKILKMPERAMIDCLIRDKFLFRQSGNLLPHQTAHSKGYFTVKTGTAEHGHNFTQTRVTGKGMEFIAARYASELML
ncbi:antirepressor [Pasteurellaceae bacterium Pebbles2]|nr:antirepressor [Pasteurellaceae bacterium Pebbles2]